MVVSGTVRCAVVQGNYVKDMTRLGRPIESVIIVDNSPASYLFQPENAIPCESFIENPADRELLEMVPFLESIAGVAVRARPHVQCSCLSRARPGMERRAGLA